MADLRPVIAGNWKMNGLHQDGLALALGIVAQLVEQGPPASEILVCPPATLVAMVAEALAGSPVRVGGQDCHFATKGAHTGDVSAAMLKDLGCSHVIVGHSERRADHGETDALVKSKAEAALAAGLIAIVCVGETEAQRDAGATLDVIGTQLVGSIPAGASSENLVIAYEPVWAIGTGRTPTEEEIVSVHGFMRAALGKGLVDADRVRLLYGGSVKPENSKRLLRLANVNGALIGGASLKVEDFCAIARACS